MALAFEKLARGEATFGIPRRLLLVTLAILVPLSYSAARASSYWLDDYILFQHTHQLAPRNTIVRNNYAIELARRGNTAAAKPIFAELLRENPDDWLATYNLDRLSYQNRDLTTARKYFDRARKIDPTRPDSFLQLGLIDMRSNRLEQAEANMRRAVALRPTDPTFRFALGVTLAQRGNCSAAESEFAQSLALKSEFRQAREQMEACRAQAGQDHAPTVPAAKPGIANLP